MSAFPVPKISVEEYLEAELRAERPSEYHDGEIFPAEAVSLNHARINLNLKALLLQRLLSAPCELFEDIKVRADDAHILIPDAVVVCGKPNLLREAEAVISNPKLIFEVLSRSTASYDYGDKFLLYRKLESFDEYVLVAQDTPRVEVFRKQESGDWLLSSYQGMEAGFSLNSVGVTLALAEIYARVVWTDTAP